MSSTADVVICGAGIVGSAAAYHLAVRQRAGRVIIVDEREPLTLTSDKGTHGYRNWWPGPDDTMLRFVSRSIDLLEESARECGNAFRMNRRGYLFATADAEELERMRATAARVSAFGMGPLREHAEFATYAPHPAEGFEDEPIGADLLIDDAARRAFPYLTDRTVGALHIRRAGTLNGVALGALFLKQAIARGAAFVRDRVTGFEISNGAIRGVRLASGETIDTPRVVLAAGPAVHGVGAMLGVSIPVTHELHAKLTFRDAAHAVPRHAPFVIWNDPLTIDGRALPGGAHLRPVDLTHGDELYLIWTYETDVRPYEWPLSFADHHQDILIRGCAAMIPAMRQYVGAGARGLLDGGFYCKTRENRPLIGRLPVDGAYICAALSGFGIMSAHAAGELVSLHVTGGELPEYAPALDPQRYDDAAYLARMSEWGAGVGQL
ncbi:MAG TPA: FAD-dependent oxidoreductase [Gemmatimonadaceae bacterium]|nr:FAD-dependent oxidoreductase [Gemmatimonadaceae bacterium]